MFVRNFMSSPAVVVPPELPARVALAYMEEREIRRLPVVEEGRLVGIVTKSDLMTLVGRERQTRRGRCKIVSDVMTGHPWIVAPDEALENAAALMLDKKVSGLPVVEDGKIVGIITESDVFRALCQMMGVGQRGARVLMSVAEGDDVLGAVKRRLNGLVMRSLVTSYNARTRRWEIVLRVRGRAAERKPVATG